MAFRTKPIALTRVPMAIRPRRLFRLGLGPKLIIEVRIEGVKHEKDDIHPWYGSLDVVRTWMNPVLEML